MTCRSICLSTSSTRIYLSVFWRLYEHLWIENSKLGLSNTAYKHFTTQTGKKLKTVFENIMEPRDRGVEGRHMGPRNKGREKQLLWKKQGNAIKKQTNDYNVSGKLYNFEKIWTFSIIYYHKKNVISLEECPAGTRHCDNVGFWLSFGRDVGQCLSNIVTTLSFRRCCSDQNLTLLQRCVFDIDFLTRY